jgi:hypothetical protein
MWLGSVTKSVKRCGVAKQACLPQGKAPIEFNLDELEDTSLCVHCTAMRVKRSSLQYSSDETHDVIYFKK